MNKEEWEIKKLGEVCIIERGGSPRPISQYITNDKNGINWIKIGDAESHSRTIKTTKEKIKPEGMSKSRYVHKGDFLLSNSMSFGRPYILDIDGCIHDGWLVIRDLNDVFDKNYLYYFLSSPITSLKFKSLAVGGVVNNLNSSMIKNLDVLIPPLPFQEKIVKELDLLSNIIAKKKEQVKELDKLAQSAFYDMFGDPLKNQKRWSLMNLKEICSSIIRGPFGSALKKDFFVPKSDSAYKVYEQKHAIQKNKTIGNYYIDEQLYNTLKRFTVYPRDI
ncbi:MAG: restriction endonuclease subunit S, partial [Bacteroidales bacterium]|nr:restriction endonuclease subunit S [Bacteroidales bacterium]